ncbi:hypothetical protein K7432_008203 [Basidiobolus ranarum]|uniref:Uncharacterized protein n=1 Tax=Basidiobolus ranarum TaxID=34480 RepID=A0ABR2WS56_9FUNG
MTPRMRLGSKFEPGVLIMARKTFGALIFAIWLAYSTTQLKKALNPPIGYEYGIVPSNMYVPTIIVAGMSSELEGVELLVGGFYPSNPNSLQPIGTIAKNTNYLNSNMTAFIVTPYTNLRFGATPGKDLRVISAMAFALSTNSTTLPYYPQVAVNSAISATMNETIYVTSLEPSKHSRIGLDQEITQDLQGRSWTAYTSQAQTLALAFFSNYPYAGMILPLKYAVNNDDLWITQTRKMKSAYTWLDLLSSMGGTLPFATGVYYILFGVGRVQPWGIFQRYILRRQVLSQVSESVLTIPKYERINDKICSDLTQSDNEKNQVTLDMPMPMSIQNFNENTSRSDHRSLNSRVAQLEAFQQRLDIFYLNHQIFEAKGSGERY